MQLVLERRAEPSRSMALLSPLLAIALTMLTGAIIFAALGFNPLHALSVFFIEPLSARWSLEHLALKAAPLVIIASGLCLCYRANVEHRRRGPVHHGRHLRLACPRSC